MLKRFYVAAVVIVAAAIQCGIEGARADWGGTGLVIGASDGHNGAYIWNADGHAYFATPQGDSSVWERYEPYDLPVPAADVKLITGGGHGVLVVTQSDAVWWWYAGTWRLMPAIPGGPVPVAGQSFAKEKGKFR